MEKITNKQANKQYFHNISDYGNWDSPFFDANNEEMIEYSLMTLNCWDTCHKAAYNCNALSINNKDIRILIQNNVGCMSKEIHAIMNPYCSVKQN